MWHAWLHYLTDEVPTKTTEYQWQQETIPNLTGTKFAYLPKGVRKGNEQRASSSSDYQAWQPE